MRKGSHLHSFACTYGIVSVPFVEKTILFSLNCCGTLVENQIYSSFGLLPRHPSLPRSVGDQCDNVPDNKMNGFYQSCLCETFVIRKNKHLGGCIPGQIRGRERTKASKYAKLRNIKCARKYEIGMNFEGCQKNTV